MIISSFHSKRKSDPKKGRSQLFGDDVVWLSFTRASFCFFCPFSNTAYLYILLFLQMEVPLPSTGGPLGEKVITTPSAVLPGMEGEPLVVI